MSNWGTVTNTDGWVISDGWVRNQFRWGVPLSGEYAAWLHYYSSSTNSWLMAFSPSGVSSVSYHYEVFAQWQPGTNDFEVQYSADGTNWTTVATNSVSSLDWIAATNTIVSFDPVWIRFLKTGDSGGLVSLGFDDIKISEPPGVVLGNLRHSPDTPTVNDGLHVLVDALDVHPLASNIAVRAWYRFDGTGPFASRTMALTTGATYRTETPIPEGRAGTVEYYVRATYDGLENDSVEFPEGGSLNAVSVTITDPVPGVPDARQLGPSSRRTPLTITEIMYHPADREDSRDIEFVEIFNSEPVTHDISGYRLSSGIDYTFPSNTLLQGRSYLVVAKDPQAIVDLYPVSHVYGPYEGRLANGGDRVRLRNRWDPIILEVEYDDELPWPVGADGAGHSIVLTAPDFGEAESTAWSASAYMGGTPGMAEIRPGDALSRVVVNEFLAHTDLPDTDFIELYNPGTQAVDLAGCVLTDDVSTNRFVIPPGTSLPSGGHVAWDQAALGYSLSMHGDDILLVDTNGNRVIAAVRFGAQANGVSSGRFPDGSADMRVLASKTAGSANSGLAQQDIVINEIMFNPITAERDDEYIELYNRGTGTVDLSHWRFTDGIDFVFPDGTELAAGGYLVVARDAANLIAKYPQLGNTNTLGDFDGSLGDRGERIVLSRPDDMDFPDQDFVVVDTVTYSDGWGEWADGGGSSLELRDPRSDNRQGVNWAGSDESAKSEWTTVDFTDYVSDGSDVNPSHGTDFNLLFVLGNQAGEFLVDDVSMAPAAGGSDIVPNGGFPTQLDPWKAYGNHWQSAQEATGGCGDDGGVLHVRAIGQGNVRSMATARRRQFDRIQVQLNSDPVQNQQYRLRAKVRWLAGWPYMRFSQGWYWFEAPVKMNVPDNLGSPGLRNSRYEANTPPAVIGLLHAPPLPGANEDVLVTCRVHDPDGVAATTLEYRDTTGTNYLQVAMRDDGTAPDAVAGDGILSALIPGQSSGTMMGFRVLTTDGAASPASARFPSAETSKDCLVRFGDPQPAGVLPDYTIWVSPENEALWLSWNAVTSARGNGMVDITFVYNGWRAIYGGKIRWRGNGRNYSNIKNASYSFEVPKENRFIGGHEAKIDIPSRPLNNSTKYLRETCAYWTCRQVGGAASQVRLIQVHVNGSDLWRHDLEPASREFCSYWYDDDDPHAFEHKAEDPLEKHVKTPTGAWNMAKYRHGVQKKRTSLPDQDYSRLMLIAEALQLPAGSVATARLLALIDPYGMAAYFAGNRVSRGKDTYGWTNMHNGFAYGSPHRRMRWHLVDMDAAFGSNFQDADGLFPTTDNTNPAWSNLPGQIYEIPVFRRAYLRILKKVAYRPFDPNRCTPFLEQWRQALIDEGVGSVSVAEILSRIAVRRGHILTELANHEAEFEITTGGGASFSTNAPVIMLAGTAPVDVRAFRLNGRKLQVAYPSTRDWEAFVGLDEGENVLQLEGFDRYGAPVASDTLSVTFTGTALSPVGEVLISEIMYHPTRERGEFVEIHNRSATGTFHLGGWRLEGADFEFDAGTVIGPGEYRVVAADRQMYAHIHTNSEVVVGELDGSLDNGGETLRLLAPVGSNAWEVIDEVTYDDDAPWPADADGLGPSLQLIDVSRDNSRIGNWAVGTDPALPGGPGAPYTPGAANSTTAALPEFPLLWINEVMPSNTTTIADNMGEFEPWIEIYNGWTGAVNLADGHALSDEGTNVMKWLFPTEQTLAAGERLLVWADGEAGETASGFLHADFRLNSASGQVVLAREIAGYPVVLDALSYSQVGADRSYGSYPEGDPDSRQVFHYPTPGNANSPSSHVTVVRINEWMADNDAFVADPADNDYEDWFELYNPSGDPVNLGGYTLTDDLAVTNRFTIPGGTVIAGQGYLLVWADNETGQNGPGADLHVNFQLSKNGEEIGLYAPDGTLVDAVTFGAQSTDESDGCWPDGIPAIHAMVPPTPGGANRVLLLGGLAVGGATPVTLTWQAESGAVYRVDWRQSLLTNGWSPLTVVTAQSDVVELIDLESNPTRFYRLTRVE